MFLWDLNIIFCVLIFYFDWGIDLEIFYWACCICYDLCRLLWAVFGLGSFDIEGDIFYIDRVWVFFLLFYWEWNIFVDAEGSFGDRMGYAEDYLCGFEVLW